MTTTTTNRRLLVLSLGFVVCLIMLYGLRPVQGHPQEDSLSEQVKALTQRLDDQKKQLDTLKADTETFRKLVGQRDRETRDLIARQDTRLNADDQKFGMIIERIRQQDLALTRLNAELVQQRNAITNILTRLRARGI